MKKHQTLCDLCHTEQKQVATLSVPKAWLPAGVGKKKKPQQETPEGHLFHFFTIGAMESTPTFDVCRGCTEALLQSGLWLKAVTA